MSWSKPYTLFVEETVAVVVGILLLTIIAIVGGSWWWYTSNTKVYSTDATKKTIIIDQGESLAGAAEKLQANNIIRNAFAFRIWAKLTGDDYTVQAGEHQFAPSMSLKEVADELSVGISDVSIRFKEGSRAEELDEAAQKILDGNYNSQEFLQKAKPLEGYLFPDTYQFQKNASTDTVIKVLNDEFESKYASVSGPQDPEKKKEVIIIASLLEREGRSDTDRPVIAGIIKNRLDRGMALDIDATLQYAKSKKVNGNWWASPLPEDKEIASPYNTYRNPGLPPAPICNPGLSSIKAAINPEESKYFFYLHDATGKAYYAKTLEEHNRNVSLHL